MDPARVAFVLVRPARAANVAAASRALKNMGARTLRLVDPPPELQGRPTLTTLKTTTGQQIYKVGGDVAAPVAIVRGDLPYPPELDGSRKIGHRRPDRLEQCQLLCCSAARMAAGAQIAQGSRKALRGERAALQRKLCRCSLVPCSSR